MDIDLLKSLESEDQMELIMMMQMEKLSDFGGPYNDVVVDDQMQTMEFHGGSSSSSGGNVPQIMDNPHVASSPPSYMNLPSTISFGSGGGAVQETAAAFPFLSGGRWRETSEFPGGAVFPSQSQKRNSMAAMREMIFRIAAMQPIHIDPESVKPPKRRNVKISKDPQSVAARHRRERISEKIRILQRLVPGGTKMDTASMLDEAIHYVKFLKTQVQSLERAAGNRPAGIGFPVAMSNGAYIPVSKANYQPAQINVQQYSDDA